MIKNILRFTPLLTLFRQSTHVFTKTIVNRTMRTVIRYPFSENKSSPIKDALQ